MRGRLIALAPPSLTPPATFDRWLTGPAGAPLAVALSGGGDSLALLRLAKAWADRAGRPLLALTVDHGLSPSSGAWSRFAAERAGRLGVPHRVLPWIGAKPDRGLPAAARAARHALLADAARAAGARVVLMGHTADDVMEAEAMRAAGASTPSPRVWSPSPAWPEGRGVFLLRPLLELRRAALRDLLRGLGETWIEDPANDDPRFARTLARRRLARSPGAEAPMAEPTARWVGLDQVREGLGGELILPRTSIPTAKDGRRVIGALALCAAGTTLPPSSDPLDRIVRRFQAGEDFVAGLAGARIEARGEAVLVCREAGEWARRGLGERPLPTGQSVFDGRIELIARSDGARISLLRGHAARLSSEARARLADLAPAVRAALPAVVSADGSVSAPMLARSGPVAARALPLARLRATLGGVSDEAALWRVAETDAGA